MANMSRRDLVKLTAAATASTTVRLQAQSSQASTPPAYTGPLTGVTTVVDDRRFDPVVYTHDRYAAAPRRLRFQARART